MVFSVQNLHYACIRYFGSRFRCFGAKLTSIVDENLFCRAGVHRTPWRSDLCSFGFCFLHWVRLWLFLYGACPIQYLFLQTKKLYNHTHQFAPVGRWTACGRPGWLLRIYIFGGLRWTISGTRLRKSILCSYSGLSRACCCFCWQLQQLMGNGLYCCPGITNDVGIPFYG